LSSFEWARSNQRRARTLKGTALSSR
jgi:hypothetical protein